MASAPAGVDWDPVDLVLEQSVQRLRGNLFNSGGELWPVEGTVSLDPLTITAKVGGFAGHGSACSAVNLWLSQFERNQQGRVVAMSGLITGRCFGTLMTPIRLQRLR